MLVEDSNGSALSGHVGALSHQLHSRLHQRLSVVLANLVLGGTGQSNVVLGVCAPWLLALNILACQQQLESVISMTNIATEPRHAAATCHGADCHATVLEAWLEHRRQCTLLEVTVDNLTAYFAGTFCKCAVKLFCRTQTAKHTVTSTRLCLFAV